MKILTKIVKGKDVDKLFDISDKYKERDIKVTIETCDKDKNKKTDEIKKLFELAKKMNVKIPADINIEKLSDDMFDVKL